MPSVLIADHCADSRRRLVEILSADAEVHVVGEAKDGPEAVRLTQSLRPQLTVLDLALPRMSGLEAAREIMTVAPTPIVILTTGADRNDSAITTQALRAGALTTLPKPPRRTSPDFAESAQRLLATVKTMSGVKVVRHHRRLRPQPQREANGCPDTQVMGQLVAIASSTGGPAALQSILCGLPRDFAAPILVVQHISAGFTEGFAAWLSAVSPIPVKVAEQGQPLKPCTVFLAPEDQHLGVADRLTVRLSREPMIGGFRPSGTFLFRSVADAFGDAAVAVILTGMGHDGVEGLAAIRQAGGQVIAQDEATSTVFGMPRAAIAAGLPHAILPPEAIARRLAEITGSRVVSGEW